MKKIILFLAVVIAFAANVKASHVVGGEISWRCLPNGQYIFSGAVFRDCTGIPFNELTIPLKVYGSPLPRNGPGGAFVSSITLKFDQVRFQTSNNGDSSPDCTPYQDQPKNCANGDQGAIQEFYYNSDPITLTGTPPSQGWTFYWDAPCCRPNDFDNINLNGNALLRAIMYPNATGQNVDPCFDSSPVFKSLPSTMICRGYEFTYNHTAIDDDLDSLIYSWDRPYNQPVASPAALPYKIGFSPTNPTPDQNFNINNIPSSLDPLSGITRMAIYSGVGPRKYLGVIRVDAYRNGVRIASIFRELPFSVFDCPDLPGFPGEQNKVPTVLIDGIPTNSTTTTIIAGQTVSIPIQVIDNDRINVAPFAQILTMVPDGLLFTQSKKGPSKKYAGDPFGEPCEITSKDVHPCAYLQGNPAPFVDATATPPVTVVKGLGVIGVEFVWQTDCKHIQTRTGFPGTNEGIYNFVMRVTDDHCPIPGINYPTVTVRVKDPIPLTEPIMKGVSVLLDGTTIYNWVPPIDSARQFNPPERRTDHYQSTYSSPAKGTPPNFWFSLDPYITNYQQSRRTLDLTPYNLNNVFDFNSGNNILERRGAHLNQSFDEYVRMRTLSGCTDTNASIWSEPAQIMKINSTPVGVWPNPERSTARLTWNRPKPLNSNTYNYFLYESPTHFYVHVNDSISNGGAGIGSNWYIAGETSGTTFDIDATTCSNYVGFRVEARDTVITWKEGSSMRSDSLDTLYFSTFSVIDTMFMEALSFIPYPSFDTIQVRADGSVFLRINLEGKRTTGSYRIFENDTSTTPLASFKALQDSVVVLSGANLNIKNIVIQAFDACKPGVKKYQSIYNTVLVDGMLTDPCKGEYTLTWNKPNSVLGIGEPDGIINNATRYRVYANFDDGNGFVLVSTINNANTTTAVVSGITRSKTFKFKVESIDSQGKLNISGVHEYTASPDLATDDLVPPPTPRCTYVNADGSVQLSWLPALDTVNNFADYRIQYKKATETNWTTFVPPLGEYDLKDSTDVITGINAQLEAFDFQITSLAGCDGDSAESYNQISSIFLQASPRQGVPSKISEISWNDFGVDYTGLGNFFDFWTSQNGQPLTTSGGISFVSPQIETVQSDACRLPVSYRLNYTDDLFQSVGFTCETQSSVADTVHIDTVKPNPENLAMLTFNRMNNKLVGYWIGNAVGADSVEFYTIDGFNSGLPILIELTDNAEDHKKASRSVEFDLNRIDARDDVRSVSMRVKDKCDNYADENVPSYPLSHKSMDVDVEWKICDSTNVVSWTQYVGLNPNFDVEYTVFFKKDGDLVWTEIQSSTTTDSTYDHLITQGGLTYHYYIQAKSLDPNTPDWVTPDSNVDSVYSIYEDTPLYTYLTYATVLPSNNVEVEYYRDTLTPVKGYTIFRGDNPEEMLPQAYYDVRDLEGQDRFTFLDVTADVNAQEYYYQVVSINDCDILTSRSNLARTIHLTVESDDEGLTNTLTWNRYLDWDSTVAYYNIYRTNTPIYSTNVYKQVKPNSAYDYNVFVDQLAVDVSSTGKYYYRVEAVQGPFDAVAAINGYSSDLTSEVSNSNIAEALQDPLMYVPNAFAPDGVNRTFGPKGQFFQFDKFEMTIFNRWGEQIFITDNINQGWDGTVDGKDASVGSYVYMIRYVDGDGEEKRKKGSVTLIR